MLELSVEKNGKVDVLDERDLASKEMSHRRQLAFNPRAHWADMGPSFGGGFRTNFASKIAPDLSF